MRLAKYGQTLEMLMEYLGEDSNKGLLLLIMLLRSVNGSCRRLADGIKLCRNGRFILD